jgi:hypothetical protein
MVFSFEDNRHCKWSPPEPGFVHRTKMSKTWTFFFGDLHFYCCNILSEEYSFVGAIRSYLDYALTERIRGCHFVSPGSFNQFKYQLSGGPMSGSAPSVFLYIAVG